jgi:hypothetical protein
LPNLNPSLCILNSFYYSEKLGIKIGEKLKRYIKSHHKESLNRYESTQLKHFGKVMYTIEEIEQLVDKIKNGLL